MKQLNCIFCLLLVVMFANVMAQPLNNSISGIVLDNATKEPLPNANIYISNTTWGTTSKLDGSFILSSIISGHHDIVFSMVGYESKSQSIILDDTSKIFLRIELIPKIYKISDITVKANRPEEWYDDLEIFKKRFLGYSPYSLECEFLNEYEINFEHPNEKTLRAMSDNPIKVINYKLGYSIKCEIINFEYTKSQKKCDYSYHLFFTELDTIDEDVKEKWERNRLKCYKESLAYFLRSLCQGYFRENGFEVALVYKPNSEGMDILSSSDLISKSSDSENYNLNFTDFLKVYNYNIEQENLRISWLKLNYPSITINKYGYPLENRAIILYGYWAELGKAS
jgi:hypothetical protein